MVEKEIKIKVTTESDIANLDELDEKMDDIQSKANIKVEVDGDSIDEATEKSDELSESLDNVDESNPSPEVDDSSIGDAKDTTEELNDELDEIDNKTVSPEVDDSSISQTKDSVDELNDSLDVMNAAALMGISSELSGIGASAEGMAQEMNTAAISVGQLATNVGMAEPQMVSLINNISNATFPQNEAMAYVNALNQMGVSADKLGDSATNMDRINDATHIGYQSVMNLTAGLRSMGITADNLPASFNAIAYAEDNVYKGTETLSQVLKTQAGTINEYGLNVDQLVVVLSTLQSQTGLTGRKLSSELGNRLKECNGDVSALEQSLGLQAGALANASNETGKYAGKLQDLANEEAEHKTFVDQLGAAWEDLSLSLSPVLEPMASVMGLIGQAGSWAVGVNGLIQLAQTTKVATAAQWLWNAAMAANPVTLLVIAIVALIAVLGYLYFNNEQVRAAIDGLGQTLMWIAGIIYDSLIGTFEWLSSVFQNFTSQIGLNTNDWKQAVLGFILFLPQLPLRVGQLLLDTVAKALGFGNNFTSTMVNGAVNAVNGFINWITSLPGKLWAELQKMLDMASNFAMEIADKLTFGGASMVAGWLSGSGEHSPGFMYDALIQELLAMLNAPEMLSELVTGIGDKGYEMANALSMAILGVDIDTAIMGWIQTFGGLQDYMLTLGGLLPQSVDITGNKIIDTLLRVMGFIATLPIQLGMHLTNMIAQALGFGSNFTQRMLSAGSNAVSNFVNQIKRLPQGLANELSEMISDALNFAGRIGQILWDAGINAITNFLNALDRHSPGIMQREFIAELTETGQRIPSEGKLMVRNMGRLGSDVVDSFHPELSDVGFANNSTGSGGVGQVNNFYFSDIVVDDDKRMQRIVEYITRELDFDNATAGRTN